MGIFSYPLVKTCVLVAQKKRLIETLLLSIHNICFGLAIGNIYSNNALLSGGLLNIFSCIQSDHMRSYSTVHIMYITDNGFSSCCWAFFFQC